ncbi:aa3-type cytochrome oxidase subunit II [Arthrobacter mobilis]|uniref:cytochrome-c oxidase n=1 Tax=Arthrobacter mobilis TaxID=2724944 RepID=A0A7X6K3Y3_9MICC|nr:cytochrome c oxidase subunit II [Arthrobacter mobilis]NKX54010.1 cytochrome c oxidase subunit II [Arthrobacter mobilis]
MSSQDRTGSRRARTAKAAGLGALGMLLLTGCSEEVRLGWLPTERGTTSHTDRLIDLWVNSWIAALIVGVITWALILWCIVAYRRRKGDEGFPRQLSYNLPIEIFYTALPLVLVLTFFYFTDRDQTALTQRFDDPQVVIDARGKQWSWDFNYVKQDKYSAGVQAHLTGETGIPETLPTLYLPVNQTVELQINSRDVIHSFWVPAFLQKVDMIPGKTNYISFTPQREGVYDGKCAELCGEFHSEMLFRVEVVSQAEFDEQMTRLNDGQIGAEYDRNPYEAAE